MDKEVKFAWANPTEYRLLIKMAELFYELKEEQNELGNTILDNNGSISTTSKKNKKSAYSRLMDELDGEIGEAEWLAKQEEKYKELSEVIMNLLKHITQKIENLAGDELADDFILRLGKTIGCELNTTNKENKVGTPEYYGYTPKGIKDELDQEVAEEGNNFVDKIVKEAIEELEKEEGFEFPEEDENGEKDENGDKDEFESDDDYLA